MARQKCDLLTLHDMCWMACMPDRHMMALDGELAREQYFTRTEFIDYLANFYLVDDIEFALGYSCTGLIITYTKFEVLSIQLYF